MIELCTDIGCRSVNKYGEQLCGDNYAVIQRDPDDIILVLADGLGSGVKACILSTLTSKIISTMLANDMSIDDCVETIAATLPVCQQRGVAYSTFTIIHVIDNARAKIIQYDNPAVILLRDGKNKELDFDTRLICGKEVHSATVDIRENDLFISMSDGAIYAGVGKTLNYGWQRENIVSFMEKAVEKDFTAKTVSTVLLDECMRYYGNQPGDDTTVCTIKIRRREPVSLMIGPPRDPADLNKMMALFFAKSGRHIVCGGTTSKLAAEYLHKPLEADIDYIDPDIPPTAKIEGVDIVSEGVVTISRVLEYAKDYLDQNERYTDWGYRKDGASQIARMLFEKATDINFFVGRAVNPAHQNPDLPITFNIKMNLVKELSACLEKMGKRIKVSYF